MTFTEAADHYYRDCGANCAEAVLRGANDVLGLGLNSEDVKLLGAFGGGCGCGSLCGAVAAGVAVIGRMNIDKSAHESPEARRKAAKFVAEARRRFGGENCRDLKVKFYNNTDRCAVTVANVAGLLDEMRSDLM